MLWVKRTLTSLAASTQSAQPVSLSSLQVTHFDASRGHLALSCEEDDEEDEGAASSSEAVTSSVSTRASCFSALLLSVEATAVKPELVELELLVSVAETSAPPLVLLPRCGKTEETVTAAWGRCGAGTVASLEESAADGKSGPLIVVKVLVEPACCDWCEEGARVRKAGKATD